MAYDQSHNKQAGRRLGDFRRAAGLSAAAAARLMDLSEQTVRAHEKGARGIRSDVAVQYGKIYGVDPALLLGLALAVPENQQAAAEALRSGLKTITDIQLPPDTPNAVMAVLSIVQGIARAALTQAEQA